MPATFGVLGWLGLGTFSGTTAPVPPVSPHLPAALYSMLTDTVTHAVYSAQDGYGTPTYLPDQARPTRVEYKMRRIVNAQGQEMMSRAKVFMDGAVPMTLRDKVVLPDGTAPAMQLLYSPTDELGVVQHHECFF